MVANNSAPRNTSEIAGEYFELGWSVIPVNPGEKKPIGQEWQNKVIDREDVGLLFKDRNIGVRLGEKSGGLVDVDLDCPEARTVAAHFLELAGEGCSDTAVFGRQSAPDSHYLFYAEGAESATYAVSQGSTLVELRADKRQTIFPGSQHPSGELIEWRDQRAPQVIDAEALSRSVRAIAAAVALAGAWAPGNRHNIALALAGGLLRNGWNASDAEDLIQGVCLAAGDEEVEDRLGAVATTAQRIAQGEHVSGVPTLAEHVGEEVVGKVAKWLDLNRQDQLVLDRTDPAPSARTFAAMHHTHDGAFTIRHYLDEWYEWEGSHYTEKEQKHVRQQLSDFLEDAFVNVKVSSGKSKDEQDEWQKLPFKPKDRDIVEVRKMLEGQTLVSKNTPMPTWLSPRPDDPDPAQLIPCRNGLLKLPERDLLNHSPRLFNLNALPYSFDRQAPQPTEWLKFLDSLWDDDPASISTLQEMFGYLLTQDTSQQKIFMLIGPRRSGKGTIGRVLQELVGNYNTVNPSGNSLNTDFGNQSLIGKQLAVFNDVRLEGKNSKLVETLLKISGEDSITIERKNTTSVTMRLNTRFLFMSNEAPAFSETSGALVGRFITLQTSRDFTGQEDRSLESRLLKELPSILNWALDGLDRLKARGYFVPPESGEDLNRQMDELASPVKAFVNERCEVGPDVRISTKELYEAYTAWCNANGRYPQSDSKFGRDLKAAVQVTKGKGTGNIKTYYGIRLADPDGGRPQFEGNRLPTDPQPPTNRPLSGYVNGHSRRSQEAGEAKDTGATAKNRLLPTPNFQVSEKYKEKGKGNTPSHYNQGSNRLGGLGGSGRLQSLNHARKLFDPNTDRGANYRKARLKRIEKAKKSRANANDKESGYSETDPDE